MGKPKLNVSQERAFGLYPRTDRRVPHISLVFREMWDTAGPTLKPVACSAAPSGCPTFAPSYVGRKRWAKPHHAPSLSAELDHCQALRRHFQGKGTAMQVLDMRRSGLLHFSQLSQLLLTGIGRRAHLVVSGQNIAVFMINPANPQRGVALDALNRKSDGLRRSTHSRLR
jgi:hypothetical protein